MNDLNHVGVVLVRPQIPANLGFVARSCKAFGCKELSLVHSNPTDILTSQAYRTASGAQELLENLSVFSSLNDACARYHHVIGFSRRSHEFERPTMDLREWSEPLTDTNHRLALIFGPEDFGLSNDEKHVCDAIVQIPSAIDTLSLNLSHAVAIVLYELFQQFSLQTNSTTNQPAFLATHEERERVMTTLVEMLEDSTYFKEGRKTYQVEILRNLLSKLQMQQPEYHTLMGVLNALDQRRRNR